MECYEECWEKTSTHKECVSIFPVRWKAKRFREEAEKEKQEWIQSLAKEHLEQVKCCEDTDCTPGRMKQAFFALKGGD